MAGPFGDHQLKIPYEPVADLLAKRPKAAWFQSGIRNDAAAERLARAGIRVVQDRCLMVEHRALAGS